MLLVDNDIVLKLCALDLMREALDCLKVGGDQVRVLDTAIHKVRSDSTRASKKEAFIKRYGDAGITRTLTFLGGSTQVSNYDQRISDRLAEVTNVDPGEAILIAATSATDGARLLTGDKRCLAAFSTAPQCADIVRTLKGRVLCFEGVLVALYDHLGFAECNRRVMAAMKVATIDGFLTLAIRDDETHVREALASAVRAVRVSCPGFFDGTG